MKKYLPILFFCTLILGSCYKDADNTKPPQIVIETSEVFINTSISGKVLDSAGELVSDYTIMVNNEWNEVNSDGFFLKLNNLKKKGQTFYVFKNDAQIGIKTHLLVENDINHMEIWQHEVLKKEVVNKDNKTVSLNGSLVADFSNTQWDTEYNGNVIARYVDIPPSISLTQVGYNDVSDVLAIESKGGFYLNLETGEGTSIGVNPEHPIIIQANNLEDDVNSIFKFDSSEEVWVWVMDIKEGTDIELLGEGYYTFANYSSGVFVEGIVTKENKPVAYQRIDWDLANLTNTICTTEKGKWIGLLPENEDVNLNLINPCEETVQTLTLGIDLEDVQGENLIIEDNDNYQLLDMTILDCEGNVVTNPILDVSNDSGIDNYFFTSQYADRWISVCDEFTIAPINESTGEEGTEFDWSTDITGDLGVLTACDEFKDGYSWIKIQGEERFYPAFTINQDGERTILEEPDGIVKLYFKGIDEGVYDVDEVNIFINDPNFGDKGYYIKCENSPVGCGIDYFNVTHLDTGENGMIRAAFSGDVWMQTLSPQVAGIFKVEGVIVIKR
ncbi:MAG: hypothetical protein P1U56_13090 [Saprospiraceae bacterium]|nr:hypothetical protein [Saprospiraceae bacterium]